MRNTKTYKIIVPYTESAAPTKKFYIEYIIEAENRCDAGQKAEIEFNLYSENTSASWIRIPDQSAIRIWRILPGDPTTPDFIDSIINSLPCESPNETIKILKRLGELEDSAASSKIIAQTKSDTPEVVSAAIYALGEIGDPTNFFAVKNIYYKAQSPEVKLAIVNTLLKLALPEDDVLHFYRKAIHDDVTRESVFKQPYSELIPLWLSEISNEHEHDLVIEASIKLGEKALMALTTLKIEDDKVFSYAAEIAKLLKPTALEYHWNDWAAVANKYRV